MKYSIIITSLIVLLLNVYAAHICYATIGNECAEALPRVMGTWKSQLILIMPASVIGALVYFIQDKSTHIVDDLNCVISDIAADRNRYLSQLNEARDTALEDAATKVETYEVPYAPQFATIIRNMKD